MAEPGNLKALRDGVLELAARGLRAEKEVAFGSLLCFADAPGASPGGNAAGRFPQGS